MSLIRNARYVFTQVPTSFPVDGKHFKYDGSPTMNLESVLLDGGVLLKTLALSVHPFLRGRMLSPETKSPVPTFKLGEAMFTHGVGVVLRSEDRDFAPGDHVVHAAMPLQEYSIAKAGPALQKIPRDAGVPWSDYIGVLGMPGMTAYTSWKEFARPQKGQTAFVSSAAGPVGSVVVQLAKLDGLKVIASSGSDEKVHFTNECGADVSFNYKTTSTDEVLAKEGPIDIYFDCVGGETLDLALKHAAQGATFIECGMVSLYNEEEKAYPYQNMMNIVGKSISLHGFVYVNLLPKWGAQFFAEMPKLVQEGKMKSQGHPSYGLDKFGEAFVQMQKGANIGKTFVVVAED